MGQADELVIVLVILAQAADADSHAVFQHAIQLGLRAIVFLKIMQELLRGTGQIQVLGRAMEFLPGFQDLILAGLVGKAHEHGTHVAIRNRHAQALGGKARSIGGDDLVTLDVAPQLQGFLLALFFLTADVGDDVIQNVGEGFKGLASTGDSLVGADQHVSDTSLRPAQLRALLESQAPLADIYKDYRDCDTNTLDVMTLCIADRADIDLMESTKKNWPPVYYQTGRYARENEELPQYRASMKLNEECRDEIDDAISYNYNGLCLDDGAVQQVLAGYGAERTRYIVAAAIQVRDGDARISPQNRRWANSVRKIKDINADGYDKAAYYANLQSHAGLIDIFTSRLRQLEREKTAPER